MSPFNVVRLRTKGVRRRKKVESAEAPTLVILLVMFSVLLLRGMFMDPVSIDADFRPDLLSLDRHACA